MDKDSIKTDFQQIAAEAIRIETSNAQKKLYGLQDAINLTKEGIKELEDASPLVKLRLDAERLKANLKLAEEVKAMKALAIASGAAEQEILTLNKQLDAYETQTKEIGKNLKDLSSDNLKALGLTQEQVLQSTKHWTHRLKELNKEYEELKNKSVVTKAVFEGVGKVVSKVGSGVKDFASSALNIIGITAGLGGLISLFLKAYDLNRKAGQSYLTAASNMGTLGITQRKGFGKDLFKYMEEGPKEAIKKYGSTIDDFYQTQQALQKGIGRPIDSASEYSALSKLGLELKSVKDISDNLTFSVAKDNIRRFGQDIPTVRANLIQLAKDSEAIGMDSESYISMVQGLTQSFEDQGFSAVGVSAALQKVYNSSILAQQGIRLTTQQAQGLTQEILALMRQEDFNPTDAFVAQNHFGGDPLTASIKMAQLKSDPTRINELVEAKISAYFDKVNIKDGRARTADLIGGIGPAASILGPGILKNPSFQKSLIRATQDGRGGVRNLTKQDFANLIRPFVAELSKAEAGKNGLKVSAQDQSNIDQMLADRMNYAVNQLTKVGEEFLLEAAKQADDVQKVMEKVTKSMLSMMGVSSEGLLKLGLALPVVVGMALAFFSLLTKGIGFVTMTALKSIATLIMTAAGGKGFFGTKLGKGIGIAGAGLAFGGLAMGGLYAGNMMSAQTTGKKMNGQATGQPIGVDENGNVVFDAGAGMPSLGQAGLAAGTGIAAGFGAAVGGPAGALAGGLVGGSLAGATQGAGFLGNLGGLDSSIKGELDSIASASGEVSDILKLTAEQQKATGEEIAKTISDKALSTSLTEYRKSLESLGQVLKSSISVNKDLVDYLNTYYGAGTGTGQPSTGTGEPLSLDQPEAMGTPSGRDTTLVGDLGNIKTPSPLSSDNFQTASIGKSGGGSSGISSVNFSAGGGNGSNTPMNSINDIIKQSSEAAKGLTAVGGSNYNGQFNATIQKVEINISPEEQQKLYQNIARTQTTPRPSYSDFA